ncbi:hypothetical protein M758_9G059900 [Ceratodon purpureus]|nr:hypothetical protein M758_9G059900 [Ceratodon purpureus]
MFGISSLTVQYSSSHILLISCSGYLAPEYMCHGQLSDKADVYSFGVLLLEIVSGKRNRDLSMPEDEVYLPNWAWKLHKESRLLDMKDPSLLLGENEAEEVQRVLETAVLCVQNAPEKRPSMFLAAAMLAGQANVDALSSIEEIDESWLQGITLGEYSDDGSTMLMNSSALTPASTGGPFTNDDATIDPNKHSSELLQQSVQP